MGGDFPVGSVVKNLPANVWDVGSVPGFGRFPGEKKLQFTLAFLPRKSHGQKPGGL